MVTDPTQNPLVDEDAVADLVEAGRLRGAVLDVFQEEPLRPDSRLWRLRSVLVVPLRQRSVMTTP